MKSDSTDENNYPDKTSQTRLTVAFVLAIDIVEHSLKATTEQAHVVRNLVDMARGCPAYCEAEASGKVISGASGDGFLLAFFDDPIAPVRCARELRAKILSSGEFQIRQAIHVGPVEVIESDISGNANFAGEAANIAARALEGCAPNEIVLTERAVEFVREDPEIADCLIPQSNLTVKHGESLNLFRLSNSHDAVDRLLPFLAKAEKIREASLRQGQTKPVSTKVIAQRLRELKTQSMVGLCVIPIALVLNYVLGATDLGTRMRLTGYEWAVGAIKSPSDESPVTFVDIADRFDNEGTGETNLPKLRALVDEIANHAPAAIAIDIDFGFHNELSSSGGGKGRYLDENEIVLRRARELTDAGCPVYLAVFEGLAMQNPDDWLGPGYPDLVVHPLRPDDALGGQILMMGDLVVGSNRIPSLSGKLANAYLSAHRRSRSAPSKIVTPYANSDAMTTSASHYGLPGKDDARISGDRLLLNTSGLEKIKNSHIDAQLKPPYLAGSDLDHRIRGKSVIIGSTGVANDFFTLGSTGKRESGPYFHAIAAETVIAAPLFQFEDWARWTLIALTGLMLVFAAYVFRRRSIGRKDWLAAGRVATIVSISIVVVVLVGAVLLARIFGVLWVDFPIVAMLLAFHSSIARQIENFWTSRTRVAGGATARL